MSKAAKKENVVQLGIFPGIKHHGAADSKPRLKTEISITVEDRETGEKCVRKIPLETDKADALTEMVEAAVKHRRTLSDISTFAKGRNGPDFQE